MLTGLLFATLAYLDHFTHHGEEITVPDLVGMSKSDLAEFLEPKSFQYVILDSVYSEDALKGTVIAQHPKPDSKVKLSRTIYLTVNAMNPPSVKLPLVVDKSLRQGTSILQNSGLTLGELIYIPDQCVNCILAQRIDGKEVKRDSVVTKGTVVDLVLGSGISDTKVLVPLLINFKRDAVISRLRESYLNIGAELYDGSVFDDADSANARVFAQYPPYGAKSWVFMGTSVDVQYTILSNKIDSNIVILDSSIILHDE